MKNKFLLAVLLLTAFPLILYPNDTKSIDRLDKRVEFLENYNKEIIDKKFENKSTELSNKIDNELLQATNKISDQYRVIEITGGVIVVLIAIGVGAMGYQYIWGFKKQADKLLRNRLDTHIKENTHLIIDIIASQKTENIIKTKRQILIIAGSEKEKEQTYDLLKKWGFNLINSVVVNKYQDVPKSDLIVFSCNDRTLPHNLILDFMKKDSEECSFIFYSNVGRLNVETDEAYSERVNFANSKYTLYHQIISTLSFKEVFKIVSHE
ncbi:MAG: NARF domain-containing protein [Cytophagaceae bacterium]